MKFIFVRHGNPNYELDCLTELGHKQAAAAADKLCKMGIEKIYSSSCGRAVETAEYTATRLLLDVHQCDFMRELNWAPKDSSRPYADGSPWGIASRYLKENRSLIDLAWKEDAFFAQTYTPQNASLLADELDNWLQSLGIKREGDYYRIEKPQYDTVAMFCHAGIFAAAITHIFNLPFPFAVLSIPCPQTGISIIEFKGLNNELVAPRLCMAGNIDHLKDSNLEIT